MSRDDPASEPGESLRRGLALRIALALAVLVAIAVLAIVAFTRSNSGSPGVEPIATTPGADPARLAQSQAASAREAPPPAAAGSPDRADGVQSQPASDAQDSSETGAPPGTGKSPPTTAPGAAAGNPGAVAGDSGAARADVARSDQVPADGAGASSTEARADSGAASLPAGRVDGDKSQADPSRAGGASTAPGSARAEGDASADASPSERTARPTGVDSGNRASARPVPDRPPRGPRLQAGVFLQPANADAFKSSLEAKGFPAYIESRVYVGPFRERKEAERARAKLQEMGITSVLIGQ